MTLTIILILFVCLLFQSIIPRYWIHEIKSLITDPEEADRLPPALFVAFSTVTLTLPGIPGSVLFLLAGRFYGLLKGFIVMIISNQIGTSSAFIAARYFCYSRVDEKVSTNVSFQAMRNAAKENEFKVLCMSRFVMVPTQFKSYIFGVSSARWSTFFISVLLGDLQSMFVGVYLGSLLRGGGSQGERKSSLEQVLSLGGFIFALLMSFVASYAARKVYKKHLDKLTRQKGEESSGFLSS